MRILLINESARVHTGGVHRMVVESCNLLKPAGHEVALAYSDGGPAEVDCRTYAFPVSHSAVEFREQLGKILTSFRPEVIQFHSTGKVWFDATVADLVPVCRFIHDQTPICSAGDRMARDFSPCHRPHGIACLFWHYLQGCGGRNPLNNWRRWQMVQGMQAVMKCRPIRLQVASEFMRRGLLENSLEPSRIAVVPLFAVPPRTTLPTEPGMLLVASRLVASKGVHLLLEALLGLKSYPWKLVVAGSGPAMVDLRAFAAQNGLAAQVDFVGEISPEQLDSQYARAQIVVTPTLRPEPFGLIGPEAMGHGKPVIAFAGGATEEWLADGETGVIVRERTPSALRAAIADLLHDRPRCEKLGALARQRFEFYRPEAYLNRLIASFERCISGADA
jgi:glycosyltransferase involved in cell wall biosynthesis